jgi:hypothetical protein
MWFAAVRTEILSSLAISALVSPRTASRATLRWAGVNFWEIAVFLPAGAATSKLRIAMPTSCSVQRKRLSTCVFVFREVATYRCLSIELVSRCSAPSLRKPVDDAD